MRKIICLPLLALAIHAHAQLTVEKIMRDPKWIGVSPANPYWSHDGRYLLFSWNPENAASDSLYYTTPGDIAPKKAYHSFRHAIHSEAGTRCNDNRTVCVYTNEGDIFLTDMKTGKNRRVTHTVEPESNPVFSFHDSQVVYTRNLNLYAWDINTGATTQLTNFQSAEAAPGPQPAGQHDTHHDDKTTQSGNSQEKWLREDALQNSAILRERKSKHDLADSMERKENTEKKLRPLLLGNKAMFGTTISPDGRFVSYRLFRTATGNRSAIVPSYVTESGYTETMAGRTKVGSTQGVEELYIFDAVKDTVWPVRIDSIPGIRDIPPYIKDYPAEYAQMQKAGAPRAVSFMNPVWSPQGHYAVIEMRAQDNKDRWLMLWNAANAQLTLLDSQHDDAWVGGPAIYNAFGNNTGWVDDHLFWFESEATGYSHLYTINVVTNERKALTQGRYEVQGARLSRDKRYFFITTNEVHPGEQQYYRVPVSGGRAERITTMTGANQVVVSPDEKWIALLYSYSTRPWELFIQENKPGAQARQVTRLAQSEEFKAYPWRDPEVITFTARDSAQVYARLYRPAKAHPSHPAVIFVHGAGYLQNAHKWWSLYFREYMFNNMLADNGYTVLDIDYRGSAGYGRDWRTGIYRHMGGKDLDDQVDGAKYLVERLGVDPAHIGIYGGSYGGFMTLMALFTTPDTFRAGAALRSVTDWAHYNHGYTSNILNEPFTDSLAYVKSSPIYFANGLKNHLLMCHGMVDMNVHFQDIVRLTQKLIELGKNNWELAVYPMEDHGFVEPSSWTDEYKRIFKLFETHLK